MWLPVWFYVHLASSKKAPLLKGTNLLLREQILSCYGWPNWQGKQLYFWQRYLFWKLIHSPKISIKQFDEISLFLTLSLLLLFFLLKKKKKKREKLTVIIKEAYSTLRVKQSTQMKDEYCTGSHNIKMSLKLERNVNVTLLFYYIWLKILTGIREVNLQHYGKGGNLIMGQSSPWPWTSIFLRPEI